MSVRETARMLMATSLLERVTLPVRGTLAGRSFFTIHPHTAVFVRSRFDNPEDLIVSSHGRIGAYLEQESRTSPELAIDLEAGYHLFKAGEFDRAAVLLGVASDHLRGWGRFREALRSLQPFLDESIKRQMKRSLVGRLMGTVGLALVALGETRRAIPYQEEAVAIARESGEAPAEARELGNLGLAYADLGETRRAIGFYEQALLAARMIDERRDEGITLGNLGLAYAELGDIGKAIEAYEQALVIARDRRDRRGEGFVVGNLGAAYATLGERHRAVESYEQALVIAREMGDRRAEGRVLNGLGVVYAAMNEASRAIAFHQQALAIGRELADPQLLNAAERALKRLSS